MLIFDSTVPFLWGPRSFASNSSEEVRDWSIVAAMAAMGPWPQSVVLDVIENGPIK